MFEVVRGSSRGLRVPLSSPPFLRPRPAVAASLSEDAILLADRVTVARRLPLLSIEGPASCELHLDLLAGFRQEILLELGERDDPVSILRRSVAGDRGGWRINSAEGTRKCKCTQMFMSSPYRVERLEHRLVDGHLLTRALLETNRPEGTVRAVIRT